MNTLKQPPFSAASGAFSVLKICFKNGSDVALKSLPSHIIFQRCDTAQQVHFGRWKQWQISYWTTKRGKGALTISHSDWLFFSVRMLKHTFSCSFIAVIIKAEISQPCKWENYMYRLILIPTSDHHMGIWGGPSHLLETFLWTTCICHFSPIFPIPSPALEFKTRQVSLHIFSPE